MKTESGVIDLTADDDEVKEEPVVAGASSAAAARPTSSGSAISLDAEIGRTVEAMLAAGLDAEAIQRTISQLRRRRGGSSASGS